MIALSFAISAANTRKLASSFSSQMTFTEADFTSNTTEYDFCFSCNALHHISTGLDFWNAVKASTKAAEKYISLILLEQITNPI